MLRRIAITLAATTAVGFLAAGTAAATPSDHFDAGGSASGSHSSSGGHAGYESLNVGGPWGITSTSAGISGYHNHGEFDYSGFVSHWH